MAITPPKFNTPDGTGTTTNLQLVTSVREQTLTGDLSSNVVDVQVKVNDEPFRSDPNLVLFDQQGFTVPNPNVYPEGLRLDYGENTIEIRVIDVTGGVSPTATATLEVVREDDLDLLVSAPTGLRVRRRRDAVELVWAANDESSIAGYHVYAAIDTGGGKQGYVRVNKDLISTVSFQEEAAEEVVTDTAFYTTAGGQLRVLLVEEDFNDNPIQTVSDSVLETAFVATGEMKVSTTLEDIRTTEYHSFVHDRRGTESDGIINSEMFADVPDDEPMHYVITAVAYDPNTNQQIESVYSSELVGLPLTITTQLAEMPSKTQDDVVRDYLSSTIRSNNRISGIPGSAVRDIFVEPFASEVERLNFLMGFIRRSQSFAQLLQIDDMDGDGESDPVSSNPYKQALKSALGFEADSDVQALIDNSFDQLAQNNNKTRGGAEYAVGQVVFYTTNEPTTDLVVEEGTLVSTEADSGGSVTFTTTSRVVLPLASSESYYNVQEKRWEIEANIRATDPGSDANVDANEIKRVIGGTTSMQVINLEATRFGRERESNARLAERAMLAFSAVDAGTPAGYLATTLRQEGVFRARVVKADDEFMMRDYDDLRDKHIGGKVDVWVQGTEEQQVSDTFALRFRVARDIQFFLDSNSSDLIFVADDPRLSPDNPISEMLGVTSQQQAQGFGFRNVSTGDEFDLTNYIILDYNRIKLDSSLNQPAVHTNDIVAGDYRFQSTSKYVFSRQPVFDVESVRSVNTGTTLTPEDNYQLYRKEDPLLMGYSTKATDYLEIRQSGGVPTGDTFVINDERHVLVGETPEALSNLGVNPISVRVFSLDRNTEYNGPNSNNPDYLIEEGDEVTPLRIVRVPSGSIVNGEEVSVDYQHDENFEVEYTINNLLRRVQKEINKQSHATADVLVKQAISNEVDLEMTIVLKPGASKAQVDANIRTRLSQLLNSKEIGEPVYQSDIVQAIENTKGVVYVVMPFSKMALQDGSLIVREQINNDATFLESQSGTKVYVFKDGLNYPTYDGASRPTLHKGIFKNTQPIEIVSSYNDLLTGSDRALVVGRNGLVISGYSDDTTLTAQGYDTAEERKERRLELTANRVFVSLDETDTPEFHEYDATYEVVGDRGSKSLMVTDVAHLELGSLTITYQTRGS
jgi:hypothetical protein